MKRVQNMLVQNRKKMKIVLPLLGCALLLAGCQNQSKRPDAKPGTEASSVSTSQRTAGASSTDLSGTSSAGRVGLCQSELSALRRINPAVYSTKKAAFDNLVNNATVYTSVRGDINAQTKDTLDALYKYKTNQMCGEIQRAVMEGLISRGESIK